MNALLVWLLVDAPEEKGHRNLSSEDGKSPVVRQGFLSRGRLESNPGFYFSPPATPFLWA